MHDIMLYYYDSVNLPISLLEANICVFLKKGLGIHEECGSYRPISLRNVDFKILAKILATRVELVLPTIIYIDQTGFIKGWSSSHNI